MSALPANVVEFKLPKRRPKVVEKEAPPDRRSVAVLPIRALTDERVTDGMFRVLGLLCSYTNRAGITWVSQKRLAEDAKVSRQAITKQLAKLRDAGYVEITRKGWRGERSNTLRVIFDPSMTAEDAIAITSSIEDTRPPAIKQEELKAMQDEEFTQEQMEANKRRLAALLATISTKQSGTRQGGYDMPKQETETVKKIKAEIAKKKARMAPKTAPTEDSHRQPNTVANEKPTHRQPHRQPDRQPNRVAQNTERTPISRYLDVFSKRCLVVKGNQETIEMLEGCMTVEQAELALEQVAARYQAEGLSLPKSIPTLVNDMIATHADALLSHQKGPTSR